MAKTRNLPIPWEIWTHFWLALGEPPQDRGHGKSMLQTGRKCLENCAWEARFWMKKWSEIAPGRVFGRSEEALGRSLGAFWFLGDVLDALGESLDRFLEALGRIWESKWSEMWFKSEERISNILIGFWYRFLMIVWSFFEGLDLDFVLVFHI